MANFGFSKPWIAKLDVETGRYSDAFRCGKGVNTTVTPAYNEASCYGDNMEAEKVSEFKNAAVALGVTTLPKQAGPMMFGHKDADGAEVSNAGDSGNYLGYGFITAEMVNGKKKYRACVLLKVLMNEGEEGYETKGDSIAFKTPNLSGYALAVENGDWRIKSPTFDTEDAADNWIQVKLNAKDQVATPAPTVVAGNYPDAQNVKLTCATEGATIKYTTDGTTPSENNGTEFKTGGAAIAIAKTTGLRAIAYKSGSVSSEIMEAEYFIG